MTDCTPKSLPRLVDSHASSRHDAHALVGSDRSLSWGDLADESLRIAAVLQSLGVRHGDRVATSTSNRLEMLSLFTACTRIGAVFAPINTRLAEKEIGSVVDDLAPTVLVDEGGPEPASPAPDVYSVRVSMTADELVARAADTSHAGFLRSRAGEVENLDQPALILYTSGTTGNPAGAVFSHRQLWWNWQMFARELEIDSDDAQLAVAPLFHAAGLNVTTMPTLLAGGTVHIRRSFDADDVAELLASQVFTTTFMVPTMWSAVADALDAHGAPDLAGFRVGVTGGAPTPTSTFSRMDALGIRLVQGYGMTEAGPMVSLLDAADASRHADSVGYAPPEVDIHAVDPDSGLGCPPGQTGELWVRGPNLARGYWRSKERESDSPFIDGWFRTGDLVRISHDGEIALLGRRHDRIITGGENVHPGEVEPLIERVDGVRAACVLGTSHPYWGEAVTAVIATRSQVAPSLQEIRAACEGELGRFKWPIRLVLVDELPRNPTGKVRRDVLNRRIASGELTFGQEHHAEHRPRARRQPLTGAGA